MIENFGRTQSGDTVQRVILTNGNLTAHVLNYGGILQDLRLAGYAPSLILGFDNIFAYETEGGYIGATVGRLANRIANGHLSIQGKEFQLDHNFRGRHTLHGGQAGTGKQIWDIVEFHTDSVIFALVLPDGHMGFPGRLRIELEWQLKGDDALSAQLRARTDAPTVCNLALHSYFNLTGRSDMHGHKLQVNADQYLAVDKDLIPTGELLSVSETDFDFRLPTSLPFNQAMDYNFCLSAARHPIRAVA